MFATTASRRSVAAVVENQGPQPSGFVQFQIDKEGKLNLLRLSFDEHGKHHIASPDSRESLPDPAEIGKSA